MDEVWRSHRRCRYEAGCPIKLEQEQAENSYQMPGPNGTPVHLDLMRDHTTAPSILIQSASDPSRLQSSELINGILVPDINGVSGCALAIADKDNINDVGMNDL